MLLHHDTRGRRKENFCSVSNYLFSPSSLAVSKYSGSLDRKKRDDDDDDALMQHKIELVLRTLMQKRLHFNVKKTLN